jgi:hypothetical protein
MIKIVLEVWKLLFNETIVGILILELENNSYSSLWFSQISLFKFV